MKKTLRLFAIAAVSMMVAVACNNAPEATEDTTAIDTPAVEEMVEDTTPVVDTIAEEPVVETPAKTTKKPAKKQVNTNTNAAEQNLNTEGSGKLTMSKNNNKKSSTGTSAADQNLNNSNSGSFGLKKN